MADLKRSREATWQGDLRRGKGRTSVASGAFKDKAFSFSTRFENEPGTNPEELIAAAHASCFSMALAGALADGGHSPERIHTRATVSLRKVDSGFRIVAVHLQTDVRVEGVDEQTLQKAAQNAKETCPVSMLLKPGLESLTFESKLIGANTGERPAPSP
jgi:lipoyl-dependent peroxiredoxin